jgi:quercetin dioxygenase-like cupin family protein
MNGLGEGMNAKLVTWDQLPEDEVYPGILRQTCSGDSATIVRYTYAPGSRFPMHSHAEEQVTVVHSGRIIFIIDEEEVELGAGQLAVIAAGTPHGAHAIGEEPVVTDNYIPSGRRAPMRIEQR